MAANTCDASPCDNIPCIDWACCTLVRDTTVAAMMQRHTRQTYSYKVQRKKARLRAHATVSHANADHMS